MIVELIIKDSARLEQIQSGSKIKNEKLEELWNIGGNGCEARNHNIPSAGGSHMTDWLHNGFAYNSTLHTASAQDEMTIFNRISTSTITRIGKEDKLRHMITTIDFSRTIITGRPLVSP